MATDPSFLKTFFESPEFKRASLQNNENIYNANAIDILKQSLINAQHSNQNIGTKNVNSIQELEKNCNSFNVPLRSNPSSIVNYDFIKKQLAGSCMGIMKENPNANLTDKKYTDFGVAQETVMNKGESSFLAKLLRDKLLDPSNNVEVLRNDIHHPLHSVSNFESLHLSPELLKGIYNMGFTKPSKIQEVALPLILGSQSQQTNLIAQSQSGTGKTAAFALGVLQKLDYSRPPECAQALILAPTYELALQIGQVIKRMGQFVPGLSIAYAVKKKRLSTFNSQQNSNDNNNLNSGITDDQQFNPFPSSSKVIMYNDNNNGNGNRDTQQVLNGGFFGSSSLNQSTSQYVEHLEDHEIFYPKGKFVNCHIVVGTPGSVVDWIRYKMLDPGAIKIFVLDEADVMIDMQGHRDSSIRIHRFLNKEQCQFLLFSATYDENDVMKFANTIVPEPSLVLRLKREEETLDNITQYYVPCVPFALKENSDLIKEARDMGKREFIYQAKLYVLCILYGSFTLGQCVIFCDSKAQALAITQCLVERCGHGSVALLTSDLSVDQRAAVIKRFKLGKDERVLVATNVVARGIDIENVSMVINFSPPRKYIEFDVQESPSVNNPNSGAFDMDSTTTLTNHPSDNLNSIFPVYGTNKNSQTFSADQNNNNSNNNEQRKGKTARATNEPDYETYLHRIGRTGRFGRNGVSFILIDEDTPYSNEYGMVKALEAFYKRQIIKLDPDYIE